MIKRKISLCLLFLMVSCSETIKNYQITSDNGQIIVKGYYKDNKPDGTWEYFDEEGKLIMQKFYFKNELKQVKYYEKNNLIYLVKYYKDSTEERIPFGDFNLYDGGKYILDTKCVSCHDYNNNSISISVKEILEKHNIKTEDYFFKQYNLDSSHKEIPLSKFEIQDILNFCREKD